MTYATDSRQRLVTFRLRQLKLVAHAPRHKCDVQHCLAA